MTHWKKNLRVHITADTVNSGGVIAYPTEAVWGLGCHPDNASGVARILELKGRSVDKGLILVAANIEQLQPYLHGLEAAQIEKMQASWPGPVTWLVPDNGAAPGWITGRHKSLAVRVTNHPLVQALCERIGGPIVSTSANPQGKISARTRFEVRRFFSKGIDYYAPGEVLGYTNPSQIRDLISDKLLR